MHVWVLTSQILILDVCMFKHVRKPVRGSVYSTIKWTGRGCIAAQLLGRLNEQLP